MIRQFKKDVYICSTSIALFFFPSQDTDLQECDEFFLPDGEISTLTLTHSGLDAWMPEWVRILLDDSTFLMCYDGEVCRRIVQLYSQTKFVLNGNLTFNCLCSSGWMMRSFTS